MKTTIFFILCFVCLAKADRDANVDGLKVNLKDANAEELKALLVQKFRDSIKKQLSARAYEEELRALLEDFRNTVINGNPEKGIPILDPYVTDSLAADIEIPLTGSLKIDMKNVEIAGLKDFIVDEINFIILSLRLNYAFTIPELTIIAENYNVVGDIAGDFDVTGNGTMLWSALNTKIEGYAKLTIKDGFLHMNIFEISIDIDEFKSELEGLLDGEDQCVFMNQVLQQVIPSVFISQRDYVSELIGERVMEFANRYLSELTLADLIDLITGGGGGGLQSFINV